VPKITVTIPDDQKDVLDWFRRETGLTQSQLIERSIDLLQDAAETAGMDFVMGLLRIDPDD
jgi:hypothetical protein